VLGKVVLRAEAQDEVGVTQVDFYVGDVWVGSSQRAPYEVTWDTATVANGEHPVVARAKDEGNNVGLSVAVPVQVANGVACSVAEQLLKDPGFESGGAGWQVEGVGVAEDEPSMPARSGRYKASLGGRGMAGVERLWQGVMLPGAACTATLRFYLQVESQEPELSGQDTLRLVLVDAESGTALQELGAWSGRDTGVSYVGRSFGVSAYRGRQLRVLFEASEDDKHATTFLVDDVTLEMTW
jgi:hypothetical protein